MPRPGRGYRAASSVLIRSPRQGPPRRSRDAHAVGRPSVIFSRRFHCGDYLGNLRIPQHGLFWESTGEIM